MRFHNEKSLPGITVALASGIDFSFLVHFNSMDALHLKG